jgi:Transcription elongation factor, N-terminal
MNDQTPCTYWAEMLAISHPEEDLSPSKYAALEKHVAQCSSCAAVRERYKLMAARVRALPDVKPLPSFPLEFLHPQVFLRRGTEIETQDVFLTDDGRQRLIAQLEFLRTAQRAKVAQYLHDAKESGDVVDNAAYEDAKNEQARLEGRILELEQWLAAAKPITKLPTDVVSLGSIVGGSQEENDNVKPRPSEENADRREDHVAG